ncbi:hypothetical protein VPHPS32B4_0081 [Vibrio phage PS32B-4]
MQCKVCMDSQCRRRQWLIIHSFCINMQGVGRGYGGRCTICIATQDFLTEIVHIRDVYRVVTREEFLERCTKVPC